LVQRFPVLRVHELADAVGGDGEAVRVEAENAILALVPFQFLVADRPFPGAHMTGGERQAAALLALQEPRVRGFEVRSATRLSSSTFIFSSCRVLRNSSAKTRTLARRSAGTTGTGT